MCLCFGTSDARYRLVSLLTLYWLTSQPSSHPTRFSIAHLLVLLSLSRFLFSGCSPLPATLFFSPYLRFAPRCSCYRLRGRPRCCRMPTGRSCHFLIFHFVVTVAEFSLNSLRPARDLMAVSPLSCTCHCVPLGLCFSTHLSFARLICLL